MSTAEEIRDEFALLSAIRDIFWTYGMRLLPDKERDVLSHLRSLGVSAAVGGTGYLILQQGSTLMVLSEACETVRKQLPQLFTADPRHDAVSSREDLERGSPSEIAHAKSDWIKSHSLEQWERLPATRAEAERKAVVPDANLNRASFLALPFSERSRLAGVLGAAGISRIMSRTK
jgi:hypothetical protein